MPISQQLIWTWASHCCTPLYSSAACAKNSFCMRVMGGILRMSMRMRMNAGVTRAKSEGWHVWLNMYIVLFVYYSHNLYEWKKNFELSSQVYQKLTSTQLFIYLYFLVFSFFLRVCTCIYFWIFMYLHLLIFSNRVFFKRNSCNRVSITFNISVLIFKKINFSNFLLPVRVCRWFKMIQAFEKRLSTEAELHGIESSHRASVENCVFFWCVQFSMGWTSSLGWSK